MKKGEWDPILPDGVRIHGIIHNRLKRIKEIIEGSPGNRSTRFAGVVETDPEKKAPFDTDPQGFEGRSARPGGIPRPEDHVQYLTIHIVTRAPKYIITKAPDCKEEIKWGDPNESYV
jgi:hypothetical protein